MNIYIERVIERIKKGEKPSGKIISKIILTDDEKKEFLTDNLSIYCYLKAHEYGEYPRCSTCNEKLLRFQNFKRGFTRYCLECSRKETSSRNSLTNVTRNRKRSDDIRKKYQPDLEKAVSEYVSNSYTIREVAGRYDLSHDYLRQYLHTNNLVHRKSKNNNFIDRVDSRLLDQNFFKLALERGSVSYGLVYNDELVSCMTFGKSRYNKNYKYELLRFANKLNTNVVGGFSKLLKAFIKTYGNSIISYCHRRLYSGNVYEKNGFKLINKTKPGYFWIDAKHNILKRYSTQKHLLKDLLGNDFNDEVSEINNMLSAGFKRVWDCGQLVFAMS